MRISRIGVAITASALSAPQIAGVTQVTNQLEISE
jgi:hypothetical protein